MLLAHILDIGDFYAAVWIRSEHRAVKSGYRFRWASRRGTQVFDVERAYIILFDFHILAERYNQLMADFWT